MRIHGTIEKVTKQDDGSLLVEGVASSESKDCVGETVTADAMRKALPDYMKFANVREMHDSKKAAGVAVECEVNDAGLTMIKALIVDPVAIIKVEAGVYKGFSIGGRVTERDTEDRKIIKGVELSEISLVDRPANPDAVFTILKVDGIDPDSEEEINKGEFPPKDEAKDDDSEEGKKKKKKAEEAAAAKESEKVFKAVVDGAEMNLRKRDDGTFEVVQPDEEELSKVSAERDDLRKAVSVLTAERDDLLTKYADLKTKFDAAPAPPKGVLLAKAVDANPDAVVPDVPMIKVNTPEGEREVPDPLALMKNVHANGAIRVL